MHKVKNKSNTQRRLEVLEEMVREQEMRIKNLEEEPGRKARSKAAFHGYCGPR